MVISWVQVLTAAVGGGVRMEESAAAEALSQHSGEQQQRIAIAVEAIRHDSMQAAGI